MNMFARFDENPAMTLQDIKKQNVTDGRTHRRRENSIPTTNKVCGGIMTFVKNKIKDKHLKTLIDFFIEANNMNHDQTAPMGAV